METADKPSLIRRLLRRKQAQEPVTDFLPDADEIERRPLPRSSRLTVHALAAALVIFLIVATVSKVDLMVIARGQLITPLPNIVIQPLENAIIKEIAVKPGQVVSKGQRLASLDSTFTEADASELKARLDSLDTQRAALEAELAGKAAERSGRDASDDRQIQGRLSDERQAAYQSRMRQLDENIARVQAAMDTNRRDQEAVEARIKVLREMVHLQEQLVAQRYAVRARYLEAQDRLLDAERSSQLARSRAVELQREWQVLRAERSSFQNGWRQKIMEDILALSRDRDSVNEQLHKAGKRHQLVELNAPSDAVVLEIARLSEGSIARGTEPLFTLVPLGEKLEVEVQINTADVGYVRLGDLAQIKVDAYPFQLHGALRGQLQTISEDAFRRDRNAAAGGDAYYLGRLRLSVAQLKGMPRHARLLPGMTVSAEIAVGKRTLISYLLWPLIKALDESLREP